MGDFTACTLGVKITFHALQRQEASGNYQLTLLKITVVKLVYGE